jgi:AAA+ ATPase superfamily predicted ATPase
LKFIDREKELNSLEDFYKRDGAQLIIIYGRRRLGKTTLISEFNKGKPAVYFLAREADLGQNQKIFQDAASSFLGYEVNYSNELIIEKQWSGIFDHLINFNYAQKVIVVLDEFQYLGMNYNGFPSMMQAVWDLNLSNKNIMLILCGSLVSMMISQK